MRKIIQLLALLGAVAATPAFAGDAPLRSLAGTWIMEEAYEVHADGSVGHAYSDHPLGVMIVDDAGHYATEIYRPGRPSFASGDKNSGTADEYRAAIVGASTHFGTVRVDPRTSTLFFNVTASGFPNLEGKEQRRSFTYRDGVLRYSVPPTETGTVAWSVWRRAR